MLTRLLDFFISLYNGDSSIKKSSKRSKKMPKGTGTYGSKKGRPMKKKKKKMKRKM